MVLAPLSVPPDSPAPLPVVTAERWELGGQRAFGSSYQNRLLLLTTLIFALSVPALWVFGYTFWVLLETLARSFDLPRGASGLAWIVARLPRSGLLLGAYGWPLDGGFILGLLSVWSGLYFAFDHLALWGHQAARQRLWAKAQTAVPNADPARAFFVELRPISRRGRVVTDTGYLILLPDKLLFLGDVEKVSLPRAAIGGGARMVTQWAGLGATWVQVPLGEPYQGVRLVARDTARRLSATRSDGERLHAALSGWHGAEAS